MTATGKPAEADKETAIPARTAARVAAVQALFQMDLAGTDLNDVIGEFLRDRFSPDGQDETVQGADRTFFADILRAVLRRQREIDPMVDEQLATGWRLVRVDAILRAILRGGVAELLDRQDVPGKVVINDRIADSMFQQIQLRPDEYSVIATLNLNGDYLSDALAAQVGGIGIAPGGNINYVTGHAVFEATHGTAPKYANLDKVNPGSVILSGVMMLEHLGWQQAADSIIASMEKTIGEKVVTYDFARLMEGATEVKCSQFADALIKNL